MSAAAFLADVERIVHDANFGQPSAAKTGRDHRWPYVPIVVVSNAETGTVRTEQIRGLAFATREEAIVGAALAIARRRVELRRRLLHARHPALRHQYGLPREVPA